MLTRTQFNTRRIALLNHRSVVCELQLKRDARSIVVQCCIVCDLLAFRA